MTVKIFVSRDSEERPWAPDYTHEVRAAQEIAKKLWQAFHHQQQLYTLIANLHEPCADMVIVTERGLGIVELKNHAGRISIDPSGMWCANGRRIESGIHADPHQQVQAYGEIVRQKTLQFILPKWLQRDSQQWNTFKFQTTVCFTHPDVELEDARLTLSQAHPGQRAPWESDFSVSTLPEITEWATRLRFQVAMGRNRRFEPYRLEPNTILNVVTLCLGAMEWSEIHSLMPTGEPYGYLVLREDNEKTQMFNLHQDEIHIGRDPDRCDVVIPGRFLRVSRIHARMTRRVDGVMLEDLRACFESRIS